eukprot:scaffold1091_cov164-Ochromonas_danica.AAC.60
MQEGGRSGGQREAAASRKLNRKMVNQASSSPLNPTLILSLTCFKDKYCAQRALRIIKKESGGEEMMAVMAFVHYGTT